MYATLEREEQMTEEEETPYLTVEEAARMLGTSKAKIRKLIKEGTLRHHSNPLDRRFHFVERAQVEELLRAGREFRHLRLDMG